ncbi:hypothetical protein [Actinopolymorpha cephalotaxi]|uniref:Uncharacterized protein n=1 Tax=Actinopolymorpha cephalotaxi TaxID=504797 RepID=A0ABX2SG24_9ACTN|nr:hypothetical protein [Actinopolymorpha cephalotaxi]NYH87121.1 hypothetical protein [Actinopolymorpha cephalotaxi]
MSSRNVPRRVGRKVRRNVRRNAWRFYLLTGTPTIAAMVGMAEMRCWLWT